MHQLRSVRAFVSSLACLLTLFFACPDAFSSTPSVTWRAKQALTARAYKQAVELLQEHLKREKATAQVLFLLGRAQVLQKDYKGAAKTLLSLVKRFPKSKLRTKALLHAADAYADAKDYKRAQAIYRKQLEHLLSDKRRIQIARIYLRYADRYYDQSRKDKAKQRTLCAKATGFYRQALALGLPAKLRRQVYLKLGLSTLVLRNTWQAQKTFHKAHKEYKKGAHADEFMFYYARTLHRRGYSRKARLLLLDFQKDHPRSKLQPKALMVLARTYGVHKRTSKHKLSLAIDVLQSLLKRYPKHALASQAAFTIGQSYFRNGRHDEAIAAFQSFLQRFSAQPNDAKRLQARARYTIGQSYFQQKRFERAIAAFQDFLKAHPTDRSWPKAQRQIVTSRYRQAETSFSRKKYAAAKQQYLHFLQLYPLDSRNPRIMSQLAQIAFAQKQYAPAIVAWQQLSSKYPSSYYGRLARWNIATTYEQKLKELDKALKAYKKIKYWRYRWRARKAIRRLTSKGLRLLTPRVFTSKEGATLKAFVRNIKTLQVRLYRIDAEMYFRKMYRFGGMEHLDIDLIRPDKTWSLKVPKYQKYKLHEIPVKLGIRKPTAAVVQISGGGFVATTVALISDLQIITKIARGHLFVFALHGKQHTPLPNARLLVSNQKKIILEGKTNAKGVYQVQSKTLKNPSQVNVLAVSKGSVAASHSSLSGLGYSVGLKPVGLLYTERPVYRPGETVHIRSILREVKDGHFLVPSKSYTLTLTAPNGRSVLQRTLKPSSFGSFHTRYTSDPSNPTGTYNLSIFRKRGPRFYASFRVQKYQLPKYQLSIKLPRRVFMRHHTITGTIRARYGFGAPAADKSISYNLGPLSGKGKTDKKGQLTFKLNTRELDLDRTYTMHARIDGENTRTHAKIWMRSAAFDLGISTVRKVYAAGESIEVSVKAADPSGTPHATKATLAWAIQTTNKAERKVGTRTLNIDKSGKASTTLTLKRGGNYILRLSSTDAWKNTISATHHLYVCGEEDKQVLRLLTDRDHFQVGQSANVKLLARHAGPALLTYEGEGVLHHKLLPKLSKGQTILPVQFTDKLSPNFALHVTLLHKQALHTARKEFVVSRKLRITIKTKTRTWTPGAKATLQIQTHDQSGKPVPAEVSLAIVDRALLSLFPDKTPSLPKVFYTHRRNLQLVTHSSHTYKHNAKSRKMSETIARYIQSQTLSNKNVNDLLRGSGGLRQGYRRRGRYNRLRRRYRQRLRRRYQRRYRYRPAPRRMRPRTRNGHGYDNGNAPSANGDTTVTTANQAATGADREKRLYLRGLRRRFATTALWRPSIHTDKQGKASLTFRLPENTATWQVHARGVAHPTLVGEAKTTLVTQKPFFAELHLPPTLSEGDQVAPRAAVHNLSPHTLKVQLKLRIPGLSTTRTLKASIPAKQSRALRFSPISTLKAGGKVFQVRLYAKGSAQKHTYTDAVQRSLTVRTPGVELHAAHAGVSQERTRFVLKLPGKGPFLHPTLTLHIGPLSPTWFVELAQQQNTAHHSLPGPLTHRAQLTLTALATLKARGQKDSPQFEALRRQLHRLTRTLWLLKQRYGGWGFIRYGSDPVFTATTFSVLVQAKQQWGSYAPRGELQRTLAYIRRNYHRTYKDETKAILLHAWVHMPNNNHSALFGYANRLMRKRTQLSLEALCHLGLTLRKLQRTQLARQLVPYIESKFHNTRHIGHKSTRHWRTSPREQAALALELLAHLAPKSKLLPQGIQWLLQQRKGLSWPSPALTSRAVRALAAYYQSKQNIKLTLGIKLNGKEIATRSLQNDSLSTTLTLHNIKTHKPLRIELSPKGIGSYQYTALLTGFSRKPDPKQHRRYHHITRRYNPAPRTVKGQQINPGFSVLRDARATWHNKVKRLPVGEYSLVTLTIKRNKTHGTRDHLVVEESLPGGAIVLPSSISSPHGRAFLEDDKIRFFLHRDRDAWTLKYRLYGSFAGTYQIPPTRVWSFSRPQLLSLGKPYRLQILPPQSKQREQYRLTPNELFYLGKAYFAAGKHQQAHNLLNRLVTKHTLRYRYQGKIAHILLKIALKRGPHTAVIRYFEMLKEHSPDTILPFAHILKIGQAYSTNREYERAHAVFQATIAARFLKELKVAATLEAEHKYKDALQFIQTLIWTYPDLRSVQSSYYALAQSAFQNADKFRKKPKRRKLWLQHAERLLREFLWLYPDNPVADAAGYTRANVLLELNKKADAIAELRALAKRYPKSGYLANMHYLEAYALYLKRSDNTRALKLLRQVSSQQYPDGKGGMQRSKDRYLATYLIAQIYHARNKLKDALAWYNKVKTRFPDAAEQARHFERILLHIPEVSYIAPEAKANLKVRHQNIKGLTLLAYYVDLMKLYLLKKNLNAVTRINLAGIRPSLQSKHTLGSNLEFFPKRSGLTLPLKRRGSYLIVLKSKQKEVSGIILRSALKLEVQQQTSSGRVTVHLSQRKTRLPVSSATVRIIGSSDKKFRSGKTDLRGIFTAENVRGNVTVIAQKDDDFAFFRGKTYLQQRRRRRRYRPRKKKKYNFDGGMLDNIRSGNRALQRRGRKQLERLYKSSPSGVQIKQFR